jgi:hypothetical protein
VSIRTSDRKPRLYRFGPRDRTGWFLGLGGAQCVTLGVGIFAAGMLLNLGAPMPLVFGPILIAVAFAFGRWSGEPVHELLPVAVAWIVAKASGRTAWFGPTSGLMPRQRSQASTEDLLLPPPLDGLQIVETTSRSRMPTPFAVLIDSRERTATIIMRAQAAQFSLCEPADQERLVSEWGDVLAAFCVERGPVGRVRWTEWSAPSALGEQLAYLDERVTVGGNTAPVAAYRTMVERAGPFSAHHEALLAVTVDERRVRRRGKTSRDLDLVNAVVEEASLLQKRLDGAGLGPGEVLGVGEMSAMLRARLDPFGLPGHGSGLASLAELVGFVRPQNAGPMAVQAEWDHVRVDRAFHAAYVIHEWPRLEVPANWMEPLLLHAGGIRTVAMHYEPVTPSRSQRRVDRESVKLVSDEEQRNRSGFRIGARHRRAHEEVLERESELVAGYAELEFVGFVVVTAPTLEALVESCVEYEQVAMGCGLELRRLDGRHDLALACGLPVGRGIAPRRFA